MACHRIITVTWTKNPGALAGTRPSSEGFIGATSLHPHGNTVEGGATIIPPISQGTEEGDGLPKVTLEVNIGTESKASPSGVGWMAKGQSSGDGGSRLGSGIGVGSSSWMENYITQGSSLTHCPQNGYEFEEKNTGMETDACNGHGAGARSWGPVAGSSKHNQLPSYILASSASFPNCRSQESACCLLLPFHALSLKTHSPLPPDSQGQFKISPLIWQCLLDANCIFGLSNFTFRFLN